MMIVTIDYYEFRTVILAYSIPRYDRWILLSERGILGCSVMSAHSCSDNVLGVLKTLHDCNSVNITS